MSRIDRVGERIRNLEAQRSQVGSGAFKRAWFELSHDERAAAALLFEAYDGHRATSEAEAEQWIRSVPPEWAAVFAKLSKRVDELENAKKVIPT